MVETSFKYTDNSNHLFEILVHCWPTGGKMFRSVKKDINLSRLIFIGMDIIE